MKTYTMFDKPLTVYGIPFFQEKKRLARLSEALIQQLPQLARWGRCCAGARLAFKTDSPTVRIRLVLKTLRVDRGMALYAGQSAQVLAGERSDSRYLGVVNPPDYETLEFEKTFQKPARLEQITIYLPRNEELETVEVSVEDSAIVTEPTPYRYEKPVVFYGSSITEGGCACNLTNVYSALLSRWLDFDYCNLGLSGSAKGELAVADYINTLDMSAFVYDYDHNAPTVEHLANTHKPFFDRIRQSHPDIPILMLTRPAEVYGAEETARREVVRATYHAALAAGDQNVYFIDGETLLGQTDRCLCTIDGCHLNDLGFYRMASVIYPVLKDVFDTLTTSPA